MIPATVEIPHGYVRLDPRDILKETDLVFTCQPGRAPVFRPTISAGCMVGEGMIYIRRLRNPPPAPQGLREAARARPCSNCDANAWSPCDGQWVCHYCRQPALGEASEPVSPQGEPS